MIKKITLLFALLIASIGFSQDLLLGFEAGESGGVNGGPFGGIAAPTVLLGTGSNTSQVLDMVGNSATALWQAATREPAGLVQHHARVGRRQRDPRDRRLDRSRLLDPDRPRPQV